MGKINKHVTHEYLQTELNKKIDKGDIANIYQFRGSVDTFDNLPYNIPVIADGFPVIESGEPLDSSYYDYDENSQTITIHEDAWSDYRIIAVPIKPVHITEGDWISGGIDLYNESIDEMLSIGYAYLQHANEFIATFVTGVANGFGYNGNSYNIGEEFTILHKPLETDIFIDENDNKIGSTYLNIGHVYNIIEDGMNYAWTGSDWDSLGGDCHDAIARNEIAQLKEDIVSAYSFCGSVDTIADLPEIYTLIPAGAPIIHSEDSTIDGTVWGSFDEKTNTVTIKDATMESDTVTIPIKPITIPAGIYYSDNCHAGWMSSPIDSYGGSPTWSNVEVNDTAMQITEIVLYNPGSSFSDVWFGGQSNGYNIYKITENDADGNINRWTCTFNPGMIYDVKSTGMSYGWTGSRWDALGTKHTDVDAQNKITNLQSQIEDLLSTLNAYDSRLAECESKLNALSEL